MKTKGNYIDVIQRNNYVQTHSSIGRGFNLIFETLFLH